MVICYFCSWGILLSHSNCPALNLIPKKLEITINHSQITNRGAVDIRVSDCILMSFLVQIMSRMTHGFLI